MGYNPYNKGGYDMPTIALFYGIYIRMNLTRKEHNPPHIHAVYGEYEAEFYISNGEIYQGKFPNKGKELVKEFILENKEALLDMWETEKYYPLPSLE